MTILLTPRRKKMSDSSRTGSGEALKVMWLLHYVVSTLTSWQRLFPLLCVPDWSSTNTIACFPSDSTVRQPARTTHEKPQPCFQFSWPHFTPLINRHFIVNLTPQNAMFFGECAFSNASRSLGIRAGVTQRTFCTCDVTNDDSWETSARLFPLMRFDLMKWCILNIAKMMSCLGKALEFPLFQ